MPSFPDRLETLRRGLDPTRHATELARLAKCRSLADLEALAREGWLTPEGAHERLRLVRHGSGTLLIVAYVDGWTRTLSQA